MTDPITSATFQALVQRWLEISTTSGESAVEMWPPISGAHRRVRQFLSDRTLLPAPNQHLFLLADANEMENISFEDIQQEVGRSLHIEQLDLNSWLAKQNRPVTLLLLGLDNTVRHHHIEALKKLSTLLETRPNLHIIWFTEINIPQSNLHQELFPKTCMLQNLWHYPLYSPQDSMQFLAYLEDKWLFTVSPDIKQQLVQQLGGHFLLLKEAARIIKANPSLPVNDLLNKPSLIRKGIAVFDSLSEPDRQDIRLILAGQRPSEISEYLQETHLIDSCKLGIPYWYHIKSSLIDNNNSISPTPYNLDYELTNSERDVLEMLQEKTDIISREEVAQMLWKDNWQEKYSDWAIDKLMSRLRIKLTTSQASFKLVTKKGQGYILLQK